VSHSDCNKANGSVRVAVLSVRAELVYTWTVGLLLQYYWEPHIYAVIDCLATELSRSGRPILYETQLSKSAYT